MKFFNSENSSDFLAAKKKFEDYKNYLREHKSFFPESAYDFATADWHYDPQDHRCPHDAWVESLILKETVRSKEAGDESILIEVTLLGAYHDGKIKISYENVNAYNLALLPSDRLTSGHGDWIIDEIRLSEKNKVIHEIKFWLAGNWKIECSDIKYEWIPFTK